MIYLFLIFLLMCDLLTCPNILKRYEEVNLILNWEKSHFMVQQGIVLVTKCLKKELRLMKSRLISYFYEISSIFPSSRWFYGSFIEYFSLLFKDTSFVFNECCEEAFEKFRSMLVSTPIVKPPNFSRPFEITSDASYVAIGLFWVKSWI